MTGRETATLCLSIQAGRFMQAAIAIHQVSKVFHTADGDVHAMGPADLEVGSGEFVSLLGPSGCGKSTLMLMIAGLIQPSSGAIRINGDIVAGPRTDIGIMFQDNTLVPWRTVRGNVELQLELRGLPPAAFASRIDGLLGSVHLAEFENRLPFELSGGMQQRAAFCQTLVHEPQMLLLDEPLGKLDAMTREAIRRDLQNLWLKTRPTVMFVTHSIEEAIQLSNKVCLITPRPGRIERVIDIDLPWPRDLQVKKSAAFTNYLGEIQEVFHGFGVI
jgi:NitT/TauT family transport system ATP-binding protein